MYSTQVSVFEKSDEISFSRFLESEHSCRLKSHVLKSHFPLQILQHLANQTLKWSFPDQELSRFLISTDLAECDSTRPVSVRFLDTSLNTSRRHGTSWRTSYFSGGTSTCGLLGRGSFGSSHLDSRVIIASLSGLSIALQYRKPCPRPFLSA